LFDSGPEVIKYTWSKTDVPIVEQIRSALNESKYPLFVAEGTTESKLEKIMHSAYLHKALRSLESTAERSKSGFVVFGHSLAENDDHILHCIGRGRMQKLLVSLYGDENNPANQTIKANARRLIEYRATANERYPLEVFFYDAESPQIWG
jgi:hypothetical protein